MDTHANERRVRRQGAHRVPYMRIREPQTRTRKIYAMSYPTGAKEDPRFERAIFNVPRAIDVESCDNCHKVLEDDEDCIYLNWHTKTGYKIRRCICMKCVESDPYWEYGRKVSQMTDEIVRSEIQKILS